MDGDCKCGLKLTIGVLTTVCATFVFSYFIFLYNMIMSNYCIPLTNLIEI